MKIFDAIQQVVPCPKTKSKGCQCDRVETIKEAEEVVKAIAQLEHTVDDVQGFVKFKQKPGQPTIIKGIVKGLTPGKHGFHIHEFGDLSDGCASAGGHYNPDGVDHGSLDKGHVGDLGNVVADQSGTARFQIKAERVVLSDIVGRAIVIHADEDDLGRGGDEESLKTGNAGDRVGCGVIRLREVVEEEYQRSVSDKHFDRNQLPQIRRNHIEKSQFDHKEGKISIDKIKPVQTQRVKGLSKKAEDVFLNNADRPFIIDRKGYLINGHHRYDAAHMLGIKRVPAIMIDADIEDVMKHFSHTSSNVEVMDENYFKKLLQEKMDNVIYKNFRRDQSIEKQINPKEPQEAWDAYTGDYLPYYFSNGMKLNLMDEDYDPNYDVWVFTDLNGNETKGEKAKDLYNLLQDMTQIPIEEATSSPGRVKRAGASCKGSATELRKKAKKYSGEKGKMYHWCANMKSGRKKS
jgi:Cu/Zn superoxide dismutase